MPSNQVDVAELSTHQDSLCALWDLVVSSDGMDNVDADSALAEIEGFDLSASDSSGPHDPIPFVAAVKGKGYGDGDSANSGARCVFDQRCRWDVVYCSELFHGFLPFNLVF